MIVKTYEEMFGQKLTIGDLVKGFTEDTRTGKVTGFDGKLDIRPPYQREFVYEMDKQKAVIKTVLAGYPLNVMYWAKKDDGTFELMDGQQRTISICKYHGDQYSVDIDVADKKMVKTFSNLDDRQQAFLDYPVTVYICDGTEDEKLAWFRIINIAGVRLTEQEMRNAIYNGTWVTDAKRYFSRDDGEGFRSEGHASNGHTYGDYVNVVGGKKSEKDNAVVRQKLLEIALGWAVDDYNRKNNLSGADKMTIDNYMDSHRRNPDARELWRYYEDVIEWVKATFPVYQDFMKSVDWGILYNQYHDNTPTDAKDRVSKIMQSADEISNIKNVYLAVLADDLKYLNARAFDKKDMKRKYNEQGGKCPYCHNDFEIDDMHGDHIRPWSKGGKTEYGNLQMLCTTCNIKKSAHDVAYKPWDTSIYEDFDLEKWDSENDDSEG